MSICDNCFTNYACSKYKSGSKPEVEFCIKQFKLCSLFDQALVSNKQRQYLGLRYDADGTDRDKFIRLSEIQRGITDFVRDGKNVYIYSTGCGNGKSSWALKLLQTYLNSIWISTEIECRALFISVPKYLIALKDNIEHKSSYVQHIKNHANSCDLVVWDDIGTKVGTEFEIENLLSIISSRIDNGKSNIYTSNISPSFLKEKVGERLFSRVVNTSELIEFKGVDKRGIVE